MEVPFNQGMFLYLLESFSEGASEAAADFTLINLHFAPQSEEARFFKAFIRMFFRFWILRYGIVSAIPHFLSKE